MITATETTLRITLTSDNAPTIAVTKEGEAVDCDVVTVGTTHYISISIGAKDLATAYDVAIGDYTISLSAMSYAYQVLSAGETTFGAECVYAMQALYNYYSQVLAYLS